MHTETAANRSRDSRLRGRDRDTDTPKDAQEADGDCGRDEGAADVHQLDREQVGRQRLGDGEADRCSSGDWPGFAQAAPTVDDGDEDERNKQGQQRGLPPDHGGQVMHRQLGELGQGGDRQAEGTKGNGRSVRDEADRGRFERVETERDEHDGTDRHRRAATGEGF